MRIFQDFFPSLRISQWTPSVLRKHIFKDESESLETLCEMMIESDGEFSSLLLAERILTSYHKIPDEESRLSFFETLLNDYDVNAEEITVAAKNYAETPDAKNLKAIKNAAEPKRQELFRRINLAQGGTRRLVKMREDLLKAIKIKPDLKKIDIDLYHLLNAWFNRGFLVMQPIDWTTPAHILEKIIAYEAVHEIKSWSELRSRLEPSDRYCYGFFHPSMEDEPLVFVEIALTQEIPESIDSILKRAPEDEASEAPSCAIFYSISTCHPGLAGVSFGNFLIKQVAISLKLRFPELKKYSTISPAPGFKRWLDKKAEDDSELQELIAEFSVDSDKSSIQRIEKLAADYFINQKRSSGEPLDPVSRFHLKNGAILERINILGDTSDNGMQQGLGTMVNYVYDLSRVEENHEAYMAKNEVVCSSSVRKLAPN